jgi:hypothetical protein
MDIGICRDWRIEMSATKRDGIDGVGGEDEREESEDRPIDSREC